MKSTLQFFILVYISFFISINAFGQKDKKAKKWGNIPQQQIDYSECHFEKDASAVKLHDIGKIEIDGVNNYNFRRHSRIKILNKNGLDYADVIIPFYSKDNLESVTNIKAHTISIKEDGTLVKTKVEKKDIFKVKINEKWSEIRFTFPNVKSGSIIEWSYNEISKNLTFLNAWYFQNEIPTLYSELSISAPSYLDYSVIYQGHRITAAAEGRKSNEWILKDLPSIKEEPYCPSPEDYAEQLSFQLSGYERRDGGYRSFVTSWDKLAEKLFDIHSFSSYYKKKKQIRKLIETHNLAIDGSEMEKLTAAYNWVKHHIKWDGKYSIYTDQSLAKMLETKYANSAEINLLLTLILKELNIQSNPLLISTKSHGLISKNYPRISQFNHLIVNAIIDGKDHPLDATDPLRPVTLLGKEDLNFYGYQISKKEEECKWVNLVPNEKTKVRVLTKVDLSNPAQVNYDVTYSTTGYKALDMRKRINADLETSLSKEFEVESQLYTFNNIEASNVHQNFDEALLLTFNLVGEESAEEQVQKIYLSPILFKTFPKNQFLQEHRELPIDLNFPFYENFVCQIPIPEAYEVDELPKNSVLHFQENDMNFKYFISEKNGLIQINSRLEINKVFYLRESYSDLKDFFRIVIAKQNEYIVLKKK